jgi:Flp pilus assembly protein TadD
MLKRTLIVLSLTIALVVAIEPLQKVQGVVLTGSEWLETNTVEPNAANAANPANAANAAKSQKAEGQGNGFLRALGAPFRAIGRLFGRGKKNENKLERISEKDAKRFESVPATQVSQTSPAPQPSSASPAESVNSAVSPAPNTALPGNAPESSGFGSAPATTAKEALEAVALDHLEKGRTLLDNHDLNGAIAELSMAASSAPTLGEPSTLLGVAYWRKGLRDMAERSFENAVRLNKDDSQNLNNLGFLLYENQDYEKATKYLKRASKLSPSDPRIWNNLGLAQSERGKFDDAFESFARAQGEYKGHLSVAARLEKRGDTKKAIKHFEKAVALQPNSPDVLVKLIELYDGKGDEKLAQSARATLEQLRTVAKTDK